ncbi:MAG: type II toxin-antitoxin system RelE/ParE family toxin [Coleofasciculus sp. C2-GNP5-27]|uniref:type II toxin-antitoxin system RelE family toxin n=1 Tax=Coleofasciculus sp. B1-GNL1-01 TaxID=3068484 RepID=UPI00330161CA
MFEIELTDQAIEDLQWFKKHQQNVIIDGIEANLGYEPATETRNRKRLRPNDTAEWELRLGVYRVLYNVEEKVRIVSIERIAAKQRNKYIFQGEEGEL